MLCYSTRLATAASALLTILLSGCMHSPLTKAQEPQKESSLQTLLTHLTRINEGRGVSFAKDDGTVSESVKPNIRVIRELIRRPENANIELAVIGHSSCEERYPLSLSYQRAEAVRRELAPWFSGLRNRINAEGRGCSEPFPLQAEVHDCNGNNTCEATHKTADETARVEFVVSSPLLTPYGLRATHQVTSPLISSRKNASVSDNERLVRLFQYLRPGTFHTGMLLPDPRAQPAEHAPQAEALGACGGYQTSWRKYVGKRDAADFLDPKETGDLYARMRLIRRVASRDASKATTALVLDIAGKEQKLDPKNKERNVEREITIPAYWALRARLPVVIPELVQELQEIIPTNDSVQHAECRKARRALSSLIDDVGEHEMPKLAQLVGTTLMQLPLTFEDVLAAQYDLHPQRGFHRLQAGMRLCVQAPRMIEKVDNDGNRDVFLAFGSAMCQPLYEITYPRDQSLIRLAPWSNPFSIDRLTVPLTENADEKRPGVTTNWHDLIPRLNETVFAETGAVYLVLPSQVDASSPGAGEQVHTFKRDFLIVALTSASTLDSEFKRPAGDDFCQIGKSLRCVMVSRQASLWAELAIERAGREEYLPLGITVGEWLSAARRNQTNAPNDWMTALRRHRWQALYSMKTEGALTINGDASVILGVPLLVGEKMPW